jgi:hypothetical protein
MHGWCVGAAFTEEMKKEVKSGVDVFKSQKVAAYQLRSYCLGMNQLMDLNKRRTEKITSEQKELMARMKNTIGVAVSAMETHIKAGKVWCTKSEEEMKKTPTLDNFSGKHEMRITGSELSDTHSIAHKLLGSEEKKEPNKDSLINNGSTFNNDFLSLKKNCLLY